MPKYSCDLGTWESGITVPFSAEDDKDAVKRAFDLSREKGLDVVQVRASPKHPGPIVWDFFNGHMDRH